MAKLPPDDDEVPDNAESRFLISLWEHLDRAEELATRADAVDHLEVVLNHCEQAADVVRVAREETRDLARLRLDLRPQGSVSARAARSVRAQVSSGDDWRRRSDLERNMSKKPTKTPRGATPKAAVAVTPPPLPRGKLGLVVQLLGRPTGATIEDLMQATGWQAHSVRGVIAGGVKKKLGLAVVSTKAEGGRVYRLEAGHDAG